MNSVELEKKLETIDITKDAPAQEPERQYYFIKRMRGILTDLEQKKGRKLTASAQTFGCQMNVEKKILKKGVLCIKVKLIGLLQSDISDNCKIGLQLSDIII